MVEMESNPQDLVKLYGTSLGLLQFMIKISKSINCENLREHLNAVKNDIQTNFP